MPTTYVPKSSAKERTGQFGSFLAIGFEAKALIEFIQANTNSRGYFNITVSKRKQPGDRGDTHSVALDTFEPNRGGGESRPSAPQPAPAPRQQPPEEEGCQKPKDDLPF